MGSTLAGRNLGLSSNEAKKIFGNDKANWPILESIHVAVLELNNAKHVDIEQHGQWCTQEELDAMHQVAETAGLVPDELASRFFTLLKSEDMNPEKLETYKRAYSRLEILVGIVGRNLMSLAMAENRFQALSNFLESVVLPELAEKVKIEEETPHENSEGGAPPSDPKPEEEKGDNSNSNNTGDDMSDSKTTIESVQEFFKADATIKTVREGLSKTELLSEAGKVEKDKLAYVDEKIEAQFKNGEKRNLLPRYDEGATYVTLVVGTVAGVAGKSLWDSMYGAGEETDSNVVPMRKAGRGN